MVRKLVLIFILSLSPGILLAQGIRGSILDDSGEPIPFATIYIKEQGTGTTSNFDGNYDIKLPSGKYNLVFQHLGYASQARNVTIGGEYVELDVVLNIESIVLRNVEIRANNEDPAYTIMRKAIAKAKFHRQQIDTYSARVYVKGSGRMLDSPFFLRKVMAKEGIDSTFTFVSESISEIKYTRPGTFEERVVSVRTSGDDNNSSPNGYIVGSFYEPDIAGSISPLSPKAFGYYKFEYLGTVRDRGYEISKIRVTPRSRGDDVFFGELNIVEDQWSIYSLDLNTEKMGIKVRIRQIYDPIEPRVWLPVSHRFDVNGKVLGFAFEYDYLATVSNYQITVNPDLDLELEVVDEKLEKELAKELEQKNKTAQVAQTKIESGQEVTRKELRKLMNAYEEQSLVDEEDPNIIENYSYKVDSLAANPDSAFWAAERPVPLSSREIMGYHKMDSMAIVEKQEAEGDTLETGRHNKSGFRVEDVLLGNTYRLGEKSTLRYFSPLPQVNFNTVEGYNFNVRFRYRQSFANRARISFVPTIRYGFSSKDIYGKGVATYTYGPAIARRAVSLSGGKFVQQINPGNPIHPLVNTFTSLLLQSNYMKIYEAGYLTARHTGYFHPKLKYSIDFSWQERSSLENNTNHTWIKQGKEYTSNNPSNAEINSTAFPYHRALTAKFGLEYQPWLKFRIRNGRKRIVNGSSPTFRANYTQGIKSRISDTNFDLLDVGFNHEFKIGVRGRVGIDLQAGIFLNTDVLYFPDFQHFAGNETPFLFNNPVGSYRLLSYYDYSTKDRYFSGLLHYQFRKFLVTQFPFMRLTGVKELAFVGYLATPYSDNYFEVGYGLDNILRFFRVEAAASFQNGVYQGFGVRVGVATSITGDGDAFNFGI